MFDFKNCVMKIISKSPTRHPISLQGKLEQSERNYIVVISVVFFKIPMNQSAADPG
jgi:hypothetical protein